MAAAAAALLPFAEKGGKAVLDIAQTPVLGWTRITSYDKGRKHPKHIEERESFNIRAWEIAALGLVGLAWWQLEELKKNTKGWSVFDLWNQISTGTAPSLPGLDLGFWADLFKLTPLV